MASHDEVKREIANRHRDVQAVRLLSTWDAPLVI